MPKKKNTSKNVKSDNCPVCKENVTKTQHALQCTACTKWFHKNCTGLTIDEYRTYERREIDSGWCCKSCTQNQSSDGEYSDIDIRETPTNKDLLTAMNKKFSELVKSITFNGEMMEDLQRTVKMVLEENKQLRKEQTDLKNKINNMEKEITVLKKKIMKEENQERRKNVIITGIKSNKDLEINVKKIISKLKVPAVNFNMVVLPSKVPDKEVIIVKFENEDQRNQMIENRKKQPLTTKDCGVNELDTKIYINEDLSRNTRLLFNKARELKKIGYKYVWCKHDQVYARLKEGAAAIKITSMEQLAVIQRQESKAVKNTTQ